MLSEPDVHLGVLTRGVVVRDEVQLKVFGRLRRPEGCASLSRPTTPFPAARRCCRLRSPRCCRARTSRSITALCSSLTWSRRRFSPLYPHYNSTYLRRTTLIGTGRVDWQLTSFSNALWVQPLMSRVYQSTMALRCHPSQAVAVPLRLPCGKALTSIGGIARPPPSR